MKLRYFVFFCMLLSFSIGADEADESGCAALQESLGCNDADDGDGDDGGGGGGTPVPPYILFTDNECEIGAAYFPYVKGTVNLTGRVWNNSYYEQSFWENVRFVINSSTVAVATSSAPYPPYYYAAINTADYVATEGSIEVILHAESAVNGTEADSDSQTYLIDNTAIVINYVTPSPGTVSGLVGIEFTMDDPVSWVDLTFDDSASGTFTKQWSGMQSSGTFTHSFDSSVYAEGTATFLIYGDDRFEESFEESLSVTIDNIP